MKNFKQNNKLLFILSLMVLFASCKGIHNTDVENEVIDSDKLVTVNITVNDDNSENSNENSDDEDDDDDDDENNDSSNYSNRYDDESDDYRENKYKKNKRRRRY